MKLDGKDTGGDPRGRRPRLPQLQHVLPRQSRLRGRRFHGGADSGNRRAPLSGRAGRELYPAGIPIYDEKNLASLIKDLKIDQCFFSYSDRLARAGDARGVALHHLRGGLRPPVGRPHDVEGESAGHRRHGRAHGRGQEPDDAIPVEDPEGERAARRRDPPSDAVRRPRGAGVPALRHGRGHGPRKLHDRGAGGVRAVDRQRASSSTRASTTGRSSSEAEQRGRRHPLGRRQQRPAVLRARSSHLRRRSAPRRARDVVPPGRGELPAGGRHPHQQVRHGRREPHREIEESSRPRSTPRPA